MDGKSLSLKLNGIRTSPLTEFTSGHAEIVVNFAADFGSLARGPRTIVCANHYEPIPSTYQMNGLVPKSPGVRIGGHRRDERQRELTLATEFSDHAALETQSDPLENTLSRDPSAFAIRWLIGLSVVSTTVAAMVACVRRPAQAEL